MSPQDGTTLQLLDQLLTFRQTLETEIERLKKVREEAGRFLEIDKEKTELQRVQAELERVQQEKQDTLKASEREGSGLREEARKEADAIIVAAQENGGLARGTIIAEARKEAETILREANQAARAQRQSAEAVYNESRRKTATVDETLGARLASCETREAAIRVKAAELHDREKAIGRVESMIDSKRQMLRAGVEGLRRVVDEIQI